MHGTTLALYSIAATLLLLMAIPLLLFLLQSPPPRQLRCPVCGGSHVHDSGCPRAVELL